MSFTKYNPEDSVVSSETVIAPLFSNNVSTLTTFTTASSGNTEYYLDVYNNSSSSGSVQFSLQYGHISGSGSLAINSSNTQNSPSRIVYGQYRNLVYGDESGSFEISSGTAAQDIYVINLSRSNYKESLNPGSLYIKLGTKTLMDDSSITSVSRFVGENKYYKLVDTGSTSIQYGIVLPDLNCIIIDCQYLYSAAGVTIPSRASNTLTNQTNVLFNALVSGSLFTLQSSETISSRYFFTRIKNGDYNYTTNPSIIDSNGNLLYNTLIDNPQTYITTVGLYNDNNELLAVAKLSRPLVKDFTKEALIRCKISF